MTTVTVEPREGGRHGTPTEQNSPSKPHSRHLENALSFFKRLDSTTSLRGNIKVHLAVDDIVKHAMSQGLEPSQIIALMDVIVSSKHKLSQTIRCKFVKCLVPSTKVPQSAVVSAISFISSKVFASSGPSILHSLLLRWILLVFDYIDGYGELHKLYNVVYCLINSHRLLPFACHLLFLLTTKQDVRLFRVHKLLGMVKALGPEPYLMGLLMIYKVYCPQLVAIKLGFGQKVFFKAHDSVWRSTIESIVKQRSEADEMETMQKLSEIRFRREKARKQPRVKRQRLLLPEAHSAAQEVDDDADVESKDPLQMNNKIQYTQIESFTAFLEAIDRIELPSQVAACLTDTRLQLVLSCNPDPLVMARLCFWIQHIFAFGFKTTDKGSTERNEKLLQMLFSFSQNVQGLPVVFGFLESYLVTWDGHSYAPLIFSLISSVKLSSYNELYNSILEPLQKIFFTADVYSKTMFISTVTKLIRNLALDVRSDSECQASSKSSGPQPQARLESLNGEADIVDEGNSSEDPLSSPEQSSMDIVYNLIHFLDVVIVVGMRMEDDHYLLQTSCLDLLQLISEVYIVYTIPLICLPMRLIHRLLLSDSAATLARLCGIMNTFRVAFVTLKSGSSEQRKVSLTCATTGSVSDNTGREKFNAVLLDVLGMLWQGRLFSDRKHTYESFFRIPLPHHLEGKIKENSLTIYKGPAFLGLSYKFLKETQRQGKPVHPSQIEEFKETYLQFLAREKFPEFLQLVNTNIKCRKNRT